MRYSQFVAQTVKKNRSSFTASMLATSFFILFDQLLAFITKILIDQLEGSRPTMFVDIFLTDLLGGFEYLSLHLWLLPILTIALALFQASLNYSRNRLTGKLQADIGYYDQRWIFSELQRSTYSSLKCLSNGDTLQTVTRDETVSRRFLWRDLVSAIYYACFQMISSFILLYFVNPVVAGFSVIILPVILLYYALGTPQVRKRYRILDESEARMTERIEENIKSARLVKAYGNQDYEKAEFEVLLLDYQKKNYRLLAYNSLFFAGGDLIVALQTVLTLIVSIVLISKGDLSIGSLTVATSFSAALIFPVKRLGRSFANYSQANVSFRRISKMLALPKEDRSAFLKPDLGGDIVFDHVSFAYEDDSEATLRDIDFTIKGGTTTAIMGKTGSGKTTLVNLLSRLYEPTSGRIMIGGTDIRDVDLSYLRDQVGVVLQEPFLFSRSVKSNIAIKDEALEPRRLSEATSIASLEETISELPEGYDTYVGEKGVSLSGGQKQRISIARTLSESTPVLIFDDSLSAVDTTTDIRIREALKTRKKGVTIIIITHRVSTAKDADQIVVFEDGKVSQRGSDAELLRQDGLYRHINRIQGRFKEAAEDARDA